MPVEVSNRVEVKEEMKHPKHNLTKVSAKLSILRDSAPEGLSYNVDVDSIFDARESALVYMATQPSVRYAFLTVIAILIGWSVMNTALFTPASIELYTASSDALYISDNSKINIEDGSKSLCKLMNGSSFILEGPASLIVKKSSFNKLTKKPTYDLYLEKGTILVSLPKPVYEGRVIVKTRHGSMEAKGTVFMIRTNDIMTSVKVYSGDVSVINKDLAYRRKDLVSSGMEANISDTGMRILPIPKNELSAAMRELKKLEDSKDIMKSYVIKPAIEKKAAKKFIGKIKYWIEN